MRYLFLLLIVIAASCNTKNNNPVAVTKTDTVYIKEYCDTLKGKEKIDTSFRTRLDTVRIEYEYDTLVFSKEEFNEIVDNFPALRDTFPDHPDDAYEKQSFADIIDKTGKPKHISFGSEYGHDIYNMLYAYIFKNRSKFAGADKLRNKLVNSCHAIRNLYQSIAGYGTYYTHQYRRIYGYAEYWTYYPGKDYEEDISPSFIEQKKDFIKTLKKEIKHKLEVNKEYLPREREAKFNELLPEFNKLESEITNLYVLRCVQEYRYTYYY